MCANFVPNQEKVPPSELTLLKRREIEARLAVPLIQAFAEKLGREEAIRVARTVIQGLARAAGLETAQKLGANHLAAFSQVVREVWAHDQALEITWLEQTDLRLSFNVTRCAYAELYEKSGVKEFGHCLSCCRDAGFASGFNPQLQLERTRTIMEGATHCDFRFRLEGAIP
jgi:predicted hydrocarbon binding protein